MAYNWSSWVGDQAFRMVTKFMMGETAASILEYMDYAEEYLPAVALKFYKKVMIVQAIVETIFMFFGNIFFLWLFNTLLLQVLISWECYRFNLNTMDVAARNALAGAISASVILLVWNLIGIIPFPITKIIIAIEGFPVIGWMIVPALLLIFNLSFGAIGKAVALSQGCAAQPAPQAKEGESESEGFRDWDQSHDNHPYPYVDHEYQQCNQAHPPKQHACDINGIVGCLPHEVIRPGVVEGFDQASCYSDPQPPTGVCGNKPFGQCDNIREQIIPLRSNYNAVPGDKF